MNMQPREIIKTCSTHYQTWKNEALNAKTQEETKKYLDKAFFWLELQNNLLMLWTIQNTMGSKPRVREKIDRAQMNINKKIANYTSQILKDLE